MFLQPRVLIQNEYWEGQHGPSFSSFDFACLLCVCVTTLLLGLKCYCQEDYYECVWGGGNGWVLSLRHDWAIMVHIKQHKYHDILKLS